jgi:hypothetical protein
MLEGAFAQQNFCASCVSLVLFVLRSPPSAGQKRGVLNK